MSVKEQAVNGILWNVLERFSTQGMQFVLTILIARLLAPGDYGLVAMLSIFLSVSQAIIDSGFTNALIQKKNRTETDCNTMFYFNIAASVLIYFVLFFSAPLIARFYHQPELVKLVRVLCLILVTNSFAAVQVARLTIALNFKKIALSSLMSMISGGLLGVVLAFYGWGVWALAFQQVAVSLVWGGALWCFSSWRPCLQFSWSSFRELFSYGYKLLFSGLLQTLYLNMYSLVIGKCFSAAALGYYNRASTLGQFPVQNFGNVVQKVLFPIQCRFQDDAVKFNALFRIYLRMSSFILFPLMIGLVVLATPVVSLMLSDKWLDMVPLLQILCLALMWYPVMQANVSVLDAKGRSDWHFRSELLKKAVAVLILLVMLPRGVLWVCWGMVLYSFADWGIIIAYSRRLTGIGYREQFRLVFPFLLLSLFMGALVGWVVSGIEGAAFRLLTGISVGGTFYVGTAFLLKFPEIKMIRSFIKERTFVADSL